MWPRINNCTDAAVQRKASDLKELTASSATASLSGVCSLTLGELAVVDGWESSFSFFNLNLSNMAALSFLLRSIIASSSSSSLGTSIFNLQKQFYKWQLVNGQEKVGVRNHEQLFKSKFPKDQMLTTDTCHTTNTSEALLFIIRFLTLTNTSKALLFITRFLLFLVRVPMTSIGSAIIVLPVGPMTHWRMPTITWRPTTSQSISVLPIISTMYINSTTARIRVPKICKWALKLTTPWTVQEVTNLNAVQKPKFIHIYIKCVQNEQW